MHKLLYQEITYKYIHKQYRTPNIASHYAISHNIVQPTMKTNNQLK